MNACVSLELAELSKRYAGRGVGLERVCLDVAGGDLLVILGPSGSGKSTLLRLVAGLEEPTTGRVRIGGVDVTTVPPHQRGVGMVFQEPALDPRRDVAANVGLGLRARRCTGRERRQRVAEVAALLGIDPLLRSRPQELSGGERQRVALGRVLAVRPRVLLLDEPLSQLDQPLRRQMRELLRDLHRRLGLTTILVTHDQTEALALGDRLAILKDGRLVKEGLPLVLYESPGSRFEADFLSQPAMSFLRLEVKHDGRRVRLTGDGQFTWEGDLEDDHLRRMEPNVSGPRLLGLRASQWEWSTGTIDLAQPPAPGWLRATIEDAEFAGERFIVRLRAGKTVLRAERAADRLPEAGVVVELRPFLDRGLWLDAEGTRRLGRQS